MIPLLHQLLRVWQVLQRHAQLGSYDFVSFVNRFDKLQFQMVLHRLDALIETPGGLEGEAEWQGRPGQR